MKKVSHLFILISLVMAILFLLTSFSIAPSFANAANYSGDYICISYDVNDESEVIWSLDFGGNIDKRGLNEGEKADYRVRVQLLLQRLLDEKIQTLLSVYQNNQKEEFLPSETIKTSAPIYDQKTDSAGFKIKYSSVEVYKFYNEKDTDRNEVYKNLLISKQIKESVFPFAEEVEGKSGKTTLARYYRNEFISACKGLSIENSIAVYNPQFIYDYSSSTNRIKSNADLTYTDANGKYHYAWGETVNNINSSIIMSMSLTLANRGWWYLFAIAIPLVIMIIAIIAVKIKEKIRKKITAKNQPN